MKIHAGFFLFTFEDYKIMERIEKLKSMLLQSPEDCFVYHALGLEYVKLNDLENALDYFNQVLFIDESYVGTYYHLAKTLEKLNETEQAIEIYEKGIEIAKLLKDNHARNELQMALDDLIE